LELFSISTSQNASQNKNISKVTHVPIHQFRNNYDQALDIALQQERYRLGLAEFSKFQTLQDMARIKAVNQRASSNLQETVVASYFYKDFKSISKSARQIKNTKKCNDNYSRVY
jgi:hypothetical protein